MILQRKYNRIIKIVRNLTPEDFYTLMNSVEKGYEAYKYLDPLDRAQDDIEEIEKDLDD